MFLIFYVFICHYSKLLTQLNPIVNKVEKLLPNLIWSEHMISQKQLHQQIHLSRVLSLKSGFVRIALNGIWTKFLLNDLYGMHDMDLVTLRHNFEVLNRVVLEKIFTTGMEWIFEVSFKSDTNMFNLSVNSCNFFQSSSTIGLLCDPPSSIIWL